jgi:transposase
MPRKRRQFSSEFKLEAVRLFNQRSAAGESLAAVSRELGIRPQLLRQWEEKFSRDVALSAGGGGGGNGKLTSQDEELRRLRKELEVLRQEAAFAKKAAVFFAKESR